VKVIVTCGHPESGYLEVHEALVAAGLARAQASFREATSATELQKDLLRSRDLLREDALSADEDLPAKDWHNLANDLFMGNSTNKDWGWADAGTTWLLEFWRSFNPQVQFVLAYSSAESTVAKMLQTMEATPDTISQAITSWMAYNTEILRFYNRNPERCMLVNATAVLHEPARFVEKAVATLGAQVELLSSQPEFDRADISAVAISLARPFIQENHQATVLYQELESSADFGDSADVAVDTERCRAWQEYMGLLDKLTYVVEERREQHKRATRLQSECRSLTEALTQSQRRTDELAGQLNDARGTVTPDRADVGHIEPMSSDLTHENELLRLQVLQVQEEFEYFVVKCEALESECRKHHAISTLLGQFLRQHFTNVVIDLRQDIDGDNWYYAEHDGRWAGPNAVSFIRVPALGQGSYKGQLNVTGSMEAEILSGMEIFLNGSPLEIINDRDNYPALISFLFATHVVEDLPMWEFQFKFPRLICPAHRGSEDQRKLAIKVRSMKLDIIP
jgi:hypothetical protein